MKEHLPARDRWEGTSICEGFDRGLVREGLRRDIYQKVAKKSYFDRSLWGRVSFLSVAL